MAVWRYFDLDRTLLPGSSLSLFGRALHRAGMVGSRRMAGYLAGRPSSYGGARGSPPLTDCCRAAGRCGRPRGGPLLDVAEGLGDELARTARPGARWLLDRHLTAGDFCVIASASPQPLVEAAAAPRRPARRRDRAEVCDGRFTGRLEGPFCHGRGKVARLWVELGTADLSQATAYSDSMSDLPLLTAAGAPVASTPTAASAARLVARAGRPHVLAPSSRLSCRPPGLRTKVVCHDRFGGRRALCAERSRPPRRRSESSRWPPRCVARCCGPPPPTPHGRLDGPVSAPLPRRRRPADIDPAGNLT